MSEALPKIDFTNLHRNTIIALCTTVCDANNESETNIVIRIGYFVKKILLALVFVHSTIIVQ